MSGYSYRSVFAAFSIVTLLLYAVGTSLPVAALWGIVAAVFMLVGSFTPRRSDEL